MKRIDNEIAAVAKYENRQQRRCRRTGIALIVLLGLLTLGAVPAGAVPAGAGPAGAGPPGASGEVCPGTAIPPQPPAVEELTPVGPPDPLPWPNEPVGGPRLTTCGDVLPPGLAAPPTVGAAAWVVADLDTGAVLAARAPHTRHRPASTLKVLTALVALDRLDPDSVVEGTADDANIEGSRVGMGPGGRYTVRQLLAGLLLNSGNDTANALARELGGATATTAAMDTVARGLGALDTRAASPSGLDGPGMASSAYDLALLFRVAMRNPLFAETVATRTLTFPGFADHPGFALSNQNRLLANYPGALGGKTGFTDAARHTFVGAAIRDGRRLVVSLVRGEQQPEPMWRQAATLLDLGFAVPPGTPPVGTLVDGLPDPPPVATPRDDDIDPDGRGDAPGLDPLAVGVAVGAATSLGLLLVWIRRRRCAEPRRHHRVE